MSMGNGITNILCYLPLIFETADITGTCNKRCLILKIQYTHCSNNRQRGPSKSSKRNLQTGVG